MPGMEHCNGTMIADSTTGPGVNQVFAPQGCSHDICRQDLLVTKDHISADRTDLVLHILVDAHGTAPAIDLLVLLDQNWRPPAEQRTTVPSNLAPLISNLRV